MKFDFKNHEIFKDCNNVKFYEYECFVRKKIEHLKDKENNLISNRKRDIHSDKLFFI